MESKPQQQQTEQQDFPQGADITHGLWVVSATQTSAAEGATMQAYSDPKRASDPHSLPDVEVFHHEHAKRERMALNAGHKAELYGECITDEEGDCLGSGWYWWTCFPGCLPDSEPNGPFKTREEALADAQADATDEDDDS